MIVFSALLCGVFAFVWSNAPAKLSASKPQPSDSNCQSSAPAQTAAHETAPSALDALPEHERASLSDALTEARYAIEPSRIPGENGALRATNYRQDYRIRFDETGPILANRSSCESWAFSLRARSYGRMGAEVSLEGPGARHVEGPRMEYRHGNLTEWYVNGPVGLEQGFTINQPPAIQTGTDAAPTLVVRMHVAGDLAPTLAADSKRVEFKDRHARKVLSYEKLVAFDAAGRTLPSRMEVAGTTLSLLVDDASARYPVTIDPYVVKYEQTLAPLDTEAQDEFGSALDFDESAFRLIIGMPGDDEGGLESGSAYIFERTLTFPGPVYIWKRRWKLVSSDAASGDRFGCSVAISGNYMAVGAKNRDESNADAGAVYVFDVFSPSNFEFGQIKKIPAPDEVGGDHFGSSVAISGATLVAGKPDHGLAAGRAYVFSKDQGGTNKWGQLATLTVSGDSTPNGFGRQVAIAGGTIVVGAVPNESAYVFVKPGGGWADMTQTAALTASDGAVGDEYGCAVSVSGDTVAVGSHKHAGGAGAAYIYVKPSGGWTDATQTAKLTASDADTADRFGFSISIDGNVAVVGAPQDQSGNGPFPNSFPAYVYEKPAGGWADMTETARLAASDEPQGLNAEKIGISVSVSADCIAVGASGDSTPALQNRGATYLFERAGANWTDANEDYKFLANDHGFSSLFQTLDADSSTLLASAKPPYPSIGYRAYVFHRAATGWFQIKRFKSPAYPLADNFGKCGAVDDSIACIGATGDIDLGGDAGAAYIYSKDIGGSDNWGLVKKVLAPDGASSDFFGCSVSLANSVLAVGAWGDDDAGNSAGAVYLFGKDVGGTDNWGFIKKITASNPTGSGFFGYKVASHGNSLLVHALKDAGGIQAVYVFDKDNGGIDNWGETAKIAGIGSSTILDLALDQDYGLVGTANGKALLVNRNQGGAGNWGLVKELLDPTGKLSNRFGESVSIKGSIALIGAPNTPIPAWGSGDGTAYILVKDLGGINNWGVFRQLVSPTPDTSTRFGSDVAITETDAIISDWADKTVDTHAGAIHIYSVIPRATRIWDGEGLGTGWEEAENWTGDLVPTIDDDVLFNDTSVKDALTFINGAHMNRLSIGPDYTGTIELYPWAPFEVAGDALLQGGAISWAGLSPIWRGHFTRTGGTFSQKSLLFYGSGTQNLTPGPRDINFGDLVVGDDATPTTLEVLGPLDARGLHVKFGSTANLNADVALTASGANLTNVATGTILIMDGVTVDATSATIGNNGLIVEGGTGKILHPATSLNVTDDAGVSSDLLIGAPFYVTLVDEDENLNGLAADTTTVEVFNLTNGDTETLTLTETGAASETFRNTIAMPTQVGSSATTGNGILEARGGDFIRIRYTDDEDSSDVLTLDIPSVGVYLPVVETLSVTPGATLNAPPIDLVATLNNDVNAATVTADTVKLIGSGPDLSFGTADDVTITPADLSVQNGNQIKLDLTGVTIPDDQYRLTLAGGTAPPTADLAGYWNFEEETGTQTADQTANGNTADLQGGTTWQDAGSFGTALGFDGIDDALKVPQDGSLEPSGGITVSVWARITASLAGDVADLVRKASPFSDGYVFRWSGNDGKLQFWVGYGGNSVNAKDTQANSAYLNAWHNFTGTFDGTTGTAKLYVDGQLRSTATGPVAPMAHTDDLYMMFVGYGSQKALPGMLDEVRIYSRALGDAEVHALADLPVGILDTSYRLLDGEYNGFLPSGDGTEGGSFVVDFEINRPPTITALGFTPGTVFTARPGDFTITLSEAADPSTVSPATVFLKRSGPDGTLGTGDDLIVRPTRAEVVGGNQIKAILDGVSLPNDQYNLCLAGISDPAGAVLDGEFGGAFPSGDGVPGGDFAAGFEIDIPVPVVTALNFTSGATFTAQPAELVATLNEDAYPASVNAGSVLLTRAGPDGTFGTSDDRKIKPASVSIQNGNQLRMDLTGILLPNDQYRLTLSGTEVSETGLKARWRLDESTGTTAFDSSGHELSGTWTGTLAWESAYYNGGLHFTSDDSRVETSKQLNAFGTGDFAVSLWMKTTDTSPYYHLVGNRKSTVHSNFWQVVFGSEGALMLEIDEDGAGTNYNTVQAYGPPVNDGQWHHFAAVRQGTTVTVYLDGVERGSGSSAGVTNLSRTGTVILGNNPYTGLAGSEKFHGSLDEVNIWSRALSLAEIQAMYATNGIRNLNQILLDGEFTGGFPSGDSAQGGNFVASFTVDVPPPVVTALNIAPGTNIGSPPTAIVATLSRDIDPATVVGASVKLTNAGPDGNLGTGDDVAILPAALTVENGNQVKFDLTGVSLPDAPYRLRLSGSAVSDTSLLALWKLNETSGATAYDSSEDGFYHAQQVGQLEWTEGIRYGATHFISNDSMFETSSKLNGFGTGDFSVSLWMKTTDTSPYYHLVGNRKSPVHSNFWQVVFGTAGALMLEIDEDGAGTNHKIVHAFGPPVNDGQWHHFAAVRQGTAITVYLDGVERGSGSSAGVTNLSRRSTVVLGNNPYTGLTGSEKFHGSLDDVRIWGRALGAGEVQKLHSLEAIRDLRSVLLDGEFSATFPSGNGVQGGDFVADFISDENPVAANDSASVNEGQSVSIDVAANDDDLIDEIDLASVQVVTSAAHGSLQVNNDGTVDYTHDGSENFTDSFTYTIDDTSGATSNVATVSLTINPVNDKPVANDDSTSVNEGQTVNFDLADNDADADDGLDLTSIQIVSNATHGTLQVNNDGTVDYTHDGSENFSDSFTYTIDDASGATSNVATVSITINAVNDAPVANDDSAGVNEGQLVNIDVADNDTDADNALDLTAIQIVTSATHGSLQVNNDGTVDYTHDGTENFSDSFIYTIDDASGATSNTATVSITINSVNDQPVAGILGSDPFYVEENELLPFEGTGTDAEDGTNVTYSWDWDDSTPDGTAQNPSHAWDEPGVYIVTLIVTDQDGLSSDPVTVQVVVTPKVGERDLFLKRGKFAINWKAHNDGVDKDSLSVQGWVNPAGCNANLSAATFEVSVNGVLLGAVSLASNGKGSTATAKASLKAKTGAFSFSVKDADLRTAIGLANTTEAGDVELTVEINVLNAGLDTETYAAHAIFAYTTTQDATSKGSFNFKTADSVDGYFFAAKTTVTEDKTGSHKVSVKGYFDAPGGASLVPAGDVTLTIGAESMTIPAAGLTVSGGIITLPKGAHPDLAKFILDTNKELFTIQTNALAGTGVPPVGAPVTSHDLLIRIEIPTAGDLVTFETTVEILRSSTTSKVWKR